LGRPEEADRERLWADEIPPEEVPAWFRSGTEHFRCRDFDAAVRDFERVMNSEPEHFTARLFLAVCFLRQKRAGEAKVALTACLAQRPTFAWSYLFRGRASLNMGDSASALQDFQRGLGLNLSEPARYALLGDLGLLHLQLQQGDQARVVLTRATELLPGESAGWVNLARLEAQQGRWPAAEEHFRKALALLSDPAPVYRERSACYRARQRWAEALADLDRTLAKEPGSSLLRAADQVERARLLVHLNNPDQALQAVRDALRIREDPDIRYLQGEILLGQHKCAEARAALDRCAVLGGNSPAVFRDRGTAHLYCGNFPAAIDDFTGALLLSRNADLLRRRGWAYVLAGAPRLAEQDFDESLKLQPGHLQAMLGRILVRIARGERLECAVDLP
jgi:tetratricopeptide (TPR) repeat protein